MGWEHYRTATAAMIPFMPGTPVFVDGMLSTVYYKIKQAGLLENSLCGDSPTHDQFIQMFDPAKKVVQILCSVEGERISPCGVSWLDSARGVDGARAANCGFAFWGGSGKTHLARDLGWLGLGYWMIDLKVNVVHGILLESNTRARNYARRLGFREAGVVPRYHFHGGELIGARAMLLEAKDFLPRFDEWAVVNSCGI